MVKRKQNMPRLSELNLTDRFLFDEVMEDAQTHQDVLSIIFGKDIQLHQNETEKELRKLPSSRSVRMDVFAVDDEQNIYNTEMQSKKRADLSKRSRYYQSMIDTTLLTTGIPDYNILNTSYIIMIMPLICLGMIAIVIRLQQRVWKNRTAIWEMERTGFFSIREERMIRKYLPSLWNFCITSNIPPMKLRSNLPVKRLGEFTIVCAKSNPVKKWG